MLSLFTSRENIHKENAMFERIDLSSKTYILVPDQYTLQMERNAVKFFKTQGLIDLEVLSFSRLTARVLSETGGSRQKLIDKNGRHMLLSKIIDQEQENFKAFAGMTKSHTFIDLLNNLIAEIKQHNSSPVDIRAALDSTDDLSLLNRKLHDVLLVFEKYEEAIKDKFIDTEEYIDFFISKISKSKLIKEGHFWISGFDSFTPKAIEIIKEIYFNAQSVNMMLTYEKESELFKLTENTIKKLKKSLGGENIQHEILTGPLVKRNQAVSHLEKNLFEYPFESVDEERPELTILSGANFYNEVESAATYIIKLIREEGLRYKDIAVICNDMEERASIIKRVFDEYGISHFIDKKHKVYHNPALAFISALLDCAASNWAYEDVFTMIKTGFTPLVEEEWEELENYSIKYKIKANRWKNDFKYGVKEYGEKGLDQLNECRKTLWEFLNPYFEENKQAETVGARLELLQKFLIEKLNMEEVLEDLCLELEEEQQFEEALEVQQIWDSVLDLFGQLDDLLGGEIMDFESFAKVIKAGFDSLELGLIPTTVDQVVVGTMQRTRIGDVKALLILAANDGILPADASGEEILSSDEKKFLLDKDILFCRDDDLKIMEENLAIYKQISSPEKYLWISYSMADLEGKEIRPSIILNKIRRIFPANPIIKDILNQENPEVLISRPTSTLKYLTQALEKHYREGEDLDPNWAAAYQWYFDKDKDSLDLIERGLAFDNRLEKLSKEAVKALFNVKDGDKLKLSPTRLERYSHCPFAHLVRYGFRPEEKRVFQVSGLEVGEAYHYCLMYFAKKLTSEGLALNHQDSLWMQISEDEVKNIIESAMKEFAENYKEGILLKGKEEEYRLKRIQAVCERAALALVDHVRQGSIDKVFFEESFSSSKASALPAISLSIADQEYLIEGIIDRVDILPDNYAKIIDYKSGKESFDPKEALGGWRLQLMIYLKAVREGMEAVEPGGVFYFEIADLMLDSEDYSEEVLASALEKEMRKRFRLDGVVLDDDKVIRNIAGDFTGYSDILPIRKSKDGAYSGNSEGRLLTKEEFTDLETAMDALIRGLCHSLFDGTIDIRPKRILKPREISACTYCDYKSICGFDLSFAGCSYDTL